jgi:hypothetical protein
MKLPQGRYSVQYLQKQTRIYSFLCTTLFTREWRSKILGLPLRKNFGNSKKNRFFFKKTALSQFKKFEKPFKKKKKVFTVHALYTTLHLVALYKIQNKITSFQNPLLWSRFVKKLTFQRKNIEGVYQKDLPLHQKDLGWKDPYSKRSQKLCFIKLKNGKPQKEMGEIRPYHPWDDLVQTRVTNRNLLFMQNLLFYKRGKRGLQIKSSKNFVDTTRSPVDIFHSQNTWTRHLSTLKWTFSGEGHQFFHKKLKRPLDNVLPNTPMANPLDFKYKNYLESTCTGLYQQEMALLFFKVENDWQHASYLADEMVYFLEKRLPFRRFKNKICKQLSQIPEIRGVRISCSGRGGGKSKKAQRAKTESIKYGQTSLQVFSSKIDFSAKTAFTSFGCVGVKVWICYN